MTRRFGRYEVLETLGAGAMGEVLRARDEMLGREVAVKTVRNPYGVAADMFRARFLAEAKALAALSHPAVVSVYDLGLEKDEPYLVMELVDGPSLKGRLEQGVMSAAEVRAMGIQLARGLEAAHARKILHRDIKPANILITSRGQWKLADFGVAHVEGSEVTMTGQFLGTPAYAAPEALALGRFSEASDVFGLAATLFEALTGRRMRGDATLSEIVRRSDEAIELPADAPPDLARALRLALAFDAERRPSAGRLAEMLAGAEHGAIGEAAIGTAVLPGPAPGASAASFRASTPGPGAGTTPLPAAAALVSSAAQAMMMPPSMTFATAATAPGLPTATGTSPGVLGTHAGVDPRRRNLRWLAIAGGAIVLVGLIAALSRSGGGGTSGPAGGVGGGVPTPTQPVADTVDEPSDEPAEPGPQRPLSPGEARKAQKDFRKIVDKLNEGKYGEATDKLDEFEQKYGRSPETEQLRGIIEQYSQSGRYGRPDGEE